LFHVELPGELGETLDWTFAEVPSDSFLDRLVLGGSTEGAFGLLVLFNREMDSEAPFNSLRTSRSVAKAA